MVTRKSLISTAILSAAFSLALAGGGGGGGGGRTSANCSFNAYQVGFIGNINASIDPSADGTCAVFEYSLFDFDMSADFSPPLPFLTRDNPSVTGYGPSCVRTVRPDSLWRSGSYVALDFDMTLRSCFSGARYWDERVEFFWLSTVAYSHLAAFFIPVEELP